MEAASVVFPRRTWVGEDGGVFRITPRKPVAELREAALAATPPTETGDFRPADLVELTSLDSTIHLDIRYATDRNFLSVPVYTQARAFLQRPAAEALARANKQLATLGYGLLIHDGYRPWYVTKMFWDGTPEDKHQFVADPASGSRHNRGCAVDLTMYELATGTPVVTTGGYDEMSDRSYPDYPGGTSRQRALREILRTAMEAQGLPRLRRRVVALRLQGLAPLPHRQPALRGPRALTKGAAARASVRAAACQRQNANICVNLSITARPATGLSGVRIRWSL